MGSISEFITRQLPSRAVGTLGVDPSATGLGEAIEGVGAAIANEGFRVLQERKQTLDIVESQSEIRKFEADMNELTKTNREQFVDDPKAGVEQFNIDGEKKLNETLGNLKDPNIRRLFAQGSSQVLRGQTNSAFTWASNQQVINAAGDFNEVINMDSGELKKAPSIDLFEKKLKILDSKKGLVKKIWGTKSGQQMANSKESLSKGYLHGLMDTNPLEGRELLKQGFFNGLLDTTEQTKFEGQMESSITGWRDKINLDARVETIQKYGGVEKIWLAGELDTSVVNALSDEMDSTLINDGNNGVISLTEKFPELKEINKNLLKIAAENTDINSIDSTKVVVDIADKVRRLNISPDKRTADAQLADIMKVRGDIIKAVANRQMKTAKAEGFLNQLTTPMIDKLSEAKGKAEWLGWGNWKTPEDAMYDSVVNKLAVLPNMTSEVSERMKANVITNTLDEINRDKLTTVTEESAIAIAGKFLEAELAKENPALANIGDKGVPMLLPSGKKVMVFKGGITIPIK